MPDEPLESQFTLQLDHLDALDDDLRGFIEHLAYQADLPSHMFASALQVLPDPSTWRLHISADMVQSINTLESRDIGNSYTLDRGAGIVGAKTIRQDDGTFDLVISTNALMAVEEVQSAEELVNYAIRAGRHTALHEAGHAILNLRGEDAGFYEDLAQGDITERGWRKFIAAHIDDFRIERMTNELGEPSPQSHSDHMRDAIEHMRAEMNASRALAPTNIDLAAFRSNTAANDLIRALVYLAAELGPPVNQEPPTPTGASVGWDAYVEPAWKAWALNLYRLKRADEPMSVEELGAVLTDLCRLTVVWVSQTIGFEWVMTDLDGQFECLWGRDPY